MPLMPENGKNPSIDRLREYGVAALRILVAFSEVVLLARFNETSSVISVLVDSNRTKQTECQKF